MVGAAAAASVVLGILMLAFPRGTLGATRWLVAAQALVIGPVLLAAALRTRERPSTSRNEPRTALEGHAAARGRGR